MNSVFIIQNQYNLYLTKQGEWTDGTDANLLYSTPHKDVAINTKVEHSVRDPLLRLMIVPCTLDKKRGVPQIGPIGRSGRDNIDQTPADSFCPDVQGAADGQG